MRERLARLGRRRPTVAPTLIDNLTPRSGVAMFDRVAIRPAPVTVDAGIAGRSGTVYGHTTPSLGYAEGLIGDPVDDLAVNVAIDGTDRTVWLTPDLVEFVDHQPGVTMRVGEKWLRREADGSWREVANEDDKP